MGLSELVAWLNAKRTGRADSGTGYLKSAAQMSEILLQERKRADRSGGYFSLVRFSLNIVADDRQVISQLERALEQKLRSTDEAGLLYDGQVGVVLPNTSAEGAWTVADNVRSILPADVTSPEFEVYEYPAGRGDGELHKQTDKTTAEQTADVEPRPALPVEIFFVKKTPMLKRSLDVLGATVGLVLLLPLLVVVAVMIKVTMPGPVFFRQLRSGRGGKPFSICKFRSMVVDAETRQKELMALNEQDGPAFKIKKDPRVTRLGRFLRMTSIDELPQLWNVLMGDMSLVGPRPLPCHEAEACHGWQRQRLDVTPGLTCIWQVKGRSKVTFDEWVRMDLRYISCRSLGADLKLLLQTVPAVVMKKGAC